jgi:peptidoglycan/xylan/chitin deacetylase (PgdA/CDA1 family)
MSDAREISAGSECTAGRRWRPAPAIQLSAALHVGGLAVVALDPLSWPYVGAALIANHVALGVAGIMPRSSVLGPNITTLPRESAARGEIALTFDDGPDPSSTPALLELLDRYGAKASFFCIGSKAARHPALVREIARRGHDVENHTHSHPRAFAAYGARRLQSEIESAQETLAAISGRAPVFFRAPMGLRNPLLDRVLDRLGLTYVSWTRRGLDTVGAKPETVLSRLAGRLAGGDVLLLHDGSAFRRRAGTAVAVSVLPALLERIAASDLKPVTLRQACRESVRQGER